jgi:hypothetical protein
MTCNLQFINIAAGVLAYFGAVHVVIYALRVLAWGCRQED